MIFSSTAKKLHLSDLTLIGIFHKILLLKFSLTVLSRSIPLENKTFSLKGKISRIPKIM
jgi:hypothetical protein